MNSPSIASVFSVWFFDVSVFYFFLGGGVVLLQKRNGFVPEGFRVSAHMFLYTF